MRHAIILTLISLLALTAAGQRRKAKAPEPKPSAESVAAKINKALDAYDFTLAAEELERYEGLKDASEETAETLRKKVEKGEALMERVQRVAVIDSFITDRDKFFAAYNLNPSTGTLSSVSTLPAGMEGTDKSVVYSTESGDRMLWGVNAGGKIRIAESNLLADGSWETPHLLDGNVNIPEASRVDFPFVMSDGVTIYFASDEPESSLGGLDIYMSRYDGEKYLEPQNLGLPFNSPADDYMMVIDEATGAGWWATERTSQPGKVTIYVFVPEESRVNYPTDTPGLASLARLTSIAATQRADADYTALREAINRPFNETHPATTDFEISLTDGTIIHRFDELPDQDSRYAMENYLDKEAELEALTADLERLRTNYGNGDTSTGADILKAEQQLPQLRSEVKRLRNLAISLAMRNRKP